MGVGVWRFKGLEVSGFRGVRSLGFLMERSSLVLADYTKIGGFMIFFKGSYRGPFQGSMIRALRFE